MSFSCRIVVLFLIVLFSGSCANGVWAQAWSAKVQRDVVYKEVDGKKILLNIALPVDENGKTRENAPLLIWIDSGCWYSDKPGNGGVWGMMKLWERGCAVASVSTRSLATDAFPAQIEDVKAAVRFLRAHAEEYGIDKNRIAVSGASSGGHLSNMLGMSDEFRLFDVGENLEESSQANVVINFYGPTDFSVLLDRYVGVECIYLALGDKPRKERTLADMTPEMKEIALKCSPITYVTGKSAPTLTFHGVMDTIVPVSQGALYYEALKSRGVRTELWTSNTGVHDIGTLGESELLARKILEFIGWEELKMSESAEK